MHYFTEETRGAIVSGLTILGAMASRKLIKKVWTSATEKDPPTNPAADDVSWRDAVIWTICTGALVGLVKLVVRRNAHVGTERLVRKR